jgi:hypothetical protein
VAIGSDSTLLAAAVGKLHSRAYQAMPLVHPELKIWPRLVHAADTAPDRADYARQVLGYAGTGSDYRDVLAGSAAWNFERMNEFRLCLDRGAGQRLAQGAALATRHLIDPGPPTASHSGEAAVLL